MRRDITLAGSLLTETARLLWRFGPMLLAVWLIGDLLQAILRELAVQIGFHSRIGGLATVALTILVRLTVLVAMLRMLAQKTGPAAALPAPEPGAQGFAADMSMVLVPFFVYYAAWGFLNEALRSYSLLSMDMDPLFQRGPIMAIDTRWVAAIWVGVAWLLRRWAKARQKQSRFWLCPFLVVVADTMWVFIGVYVIGVWRSQVQGWLAALPNPSDLIDGLIGAAGAQVMPLPFSPPSQPADIPLESVSDLFWRVFYFALLPVVWFNLAAIIRGHDLARAPTEAGLVVSGWEKLPKALRDFSGHFFMGMLKRWNAVANGVRMMFSAGIATMVTLVVLMRGVDWLAGWGYVWLGQALGPMPYYESQALQPALEILFGPARQPGLGLLPEVVKICLLSATLNFVAARSTQSAP